MRRATTAKRRRQRAAGIENEQITRPQVIVDLIETRVLDVAGRALDHKQAHLISPDSATLRRLFCAQLRRQREGKWRGHVLFVILSEVSRCGDSVTSVV